MLAERRLHRDSDHDFRGAGHAGQLRLVNDLHALRAGETLAGARISVSIQSKRLYAETSPKLIFHSAVYMVAVSTLPTDLQMVFTDPDSTRTVVDWPTHCFRDIYNTHYATPDLALSSQSNSFATPPNVETYRSAPVPDLIQTMSVVGDDELEPDYREMIYLQTGHMLPEMGCEKLSSRTSLSNFGDVEVVAGDRAGRLEASHLHSISKNHVAAEYSFICVVAGTWVQPYYNQPPYALDSASASNSPNLMYPQQSRFDSTLLATQDEWIMRLTDAVNNLGDVDQQGNTSEATINYFEGGSVQFQSDSRRPKMLNDDGDGYVTGGFASDGALSADQALAGRYDHYIDCWGGFSDLTDLGLF